MDPQEAVVFKNGRPPFERSRVKLLVFSFKKLFLQEGKGIFLLVRRFGGGGSKPINRAEK